MDHTEDQARLCSPSRDALRHVAFNLGEERISLEALEAEEPGREAPDVLVDGAFVGGDAVLAEDAECGVREPAPEQLAFLLEDEAVHLGVHGHHHPLPHQNVGMSREGLGLKSWKVSPTRGKPMEPGGSIPVLSHGGLIQLYTRRTSQPATTTARP